MNTVATVTTCLALRDRGDTELAAGPRPYAITMLDNLAAVVTDPGLGVRASGRAQVSYSLVLGLYAIADVETDPRQSREVALAAYWNEGFAPPPDQPQTEPSPTIGLVLLRGAGVPYRSLDAHARAVADDGAPEPDGGPSDDGASLPAEPSAHEDATSPAAVRSHVEGVMRPPDGRPGNSRTPCHHGLARLPPPASSGHPTISTAATRVA